MLCTTYNLYCPNTFFILILGWNMSRTWRRGLLLTSRNPVGFPDWVDALLTHSFSLFCWESDDELLIPEVGGALPARCKAALFPLAEKSQYISSLTDTQCESEQRQSHRVFRALWGQTERPRRKLSAHPPKDCKRRLERLQVSSKYVWICDSWAFVCVDEFRGNTSLSCFAFWMHASWFCLIERLLTFHFAFNHPIQPWI